MIVETNWNFQVTEINSSTDTLEADFLVSWAFVENWTKTMKSV